MSFYAIIPARGGSKGVPKKNIKLLGNFPLIAYSIAAAKMCTQIQKVIVSTDSEEIAEIALKFGAEVPFLRPADISQDNSSDLEFMQHIIHWFLENDVKLPDFWVHLRPTTPLREASILNNAIKLFLENKDFTSLRSAHECPESPYKWFLKDNLNKYFEPLAGKDINNYSIAPRQQVPKVYVPDGYIDILITDKILQKNSLHGDKILAFESPVCTEIDTINDFEYLEYQILKYKYNVHDYLVNKY